jgi:pimeloyl-ACP methyl ester carboxylesterase
MSTVVKPTEGSDQTAVHPFHVDVPEAELTDLRRRIRVPGEIYQAPRSWTEQAYPKLIHYNKVAKGGHYAPWEQPKIFSEEVRAGLRSLRA